jgi:hypothetical protein
LVIGLDGWVVQPFGDWHFDVTIRELYADMAVARAKATEQPDFITFLLACIHHKARHGSLPPSSEAIENGFYRRLAWFACLVR